MRLLAPVVLAVLLLGGCTGSDDTPQASAPTPSATPTAPELTEGNNAPGEDLVVGPDCRRIWKSGATLPADFTTCVLDGRTPEFDVTTCNDGSKLIVADNVMWGRTGQGEIKRTDESPLQDTDAYGTDWSLCTGQ